MLTKKEAEIVAMCRKEHLSLNQIRQIQEFRPTSLGLDRNIFTALRILSTVRAIAMNKQEDKIKWCHQAFLAFLENNLFKDGSTYDFREHGSLLHHEEVLVCSLLITHYLEILQPNFNFIHHKTKNGASLFSAILFMIPFIKGQKTNILFRFSTHGNDRTEYHQAFLKKWEPSNHMTQLMSILRETRPLLHSKIQKHLNA